LVHPAPEVLVLRQCVGREDGSNDSGVGPTVLNGYGVGCARARLCSSLAAQGWFATASSLFLCGERDGFRERRCDGNQHGARYDSADDASVHTPSWGGS